ncbi:uncharacterized protein N0V89_003661 [Didymosphaeria variabile]|uniref:Uncharacterized protein n=1 Tax=Didymosphaeria variabile TaxID=1932322 RepID=A0A9W8XQD2_9PLEO|nr:uncharacterized protein N0V89_003661 [Didymosphaeria variabile]KAJ4355641.1 hypothetical protein N0V89_003661 [Didymosphaeria variabile]
MDSQVTLWHRSPQNRFEDVDVLGETVEDVHFSRDGDHLVIQTSSSGAPRVIPVSVPYQGQTASSARGQVEDLTAQNSALSKKPSSAPIINLPEHSSSGVFKSGTSIAEDGGASGLAMVHSGTQITIRKWSREDAASSQDAKEEVLQLTRLPGTMSSGSAAVSVPRPGEDQVHVVINKNARQWDDMVQDVDVHLPALVSRDIGDLKIEDSSGSSKRLRDAGRVAIGK